MNNNGVASKGIRSIAVIGGLWPRCKACGHIAQAHGEKDSDMTCCEQVTKQCPTCGQHGGKLPCGCKDYDGPTWETFKKDYLTAEEIAYYHWS